MAQAIGVGLGIASVLIVLVWGLPMEKLIQGFLLDDTFYYFQVARVFAQKGIFSFDGVHETNGFHPLWMLILLPFAFLVQEPEAFVRTALSVAAMFVGIASGILWQMLRRAIGPLYGGVVWLFLLLLYQATWALLSGMEGSVSIVLLLLSLQLYGRLRAKKSHANFYLLSLTLGLLALARIEGILFITTTIVAFWIEDKSPLQERVRWGIRLGLLSSILPGIYFVWNTLHFGHPLPVSALVKSHSSLKQNLPSFLADFASLLASPLWGLGLLLLGVGIATIIWTKRQASRQVSAKIEPLPGLLPLLLMAAIHLISVALFIGSLLFVWYFFWEVTAAGWFLVWVGQQLLQTYPVIARILWIGTAFVSILWTGYIQVFRWGPENIFKLVLYETSLWMRDNLPAQARVAAFDSGILGYFSNRSVTNLDGLANHPSYLSYLWSRRIADYLQYEKIPYLVQYVQAGQTFFPRYSIPDSLIADTLYKRDFTFRTTGILVAKQSQKEMYAVRLNIPQ